MRKAHKRYAILSRHCVHRWPQGAHKLRKLGNIARDVFVCGQSERHHAKADSRTAHECFGRDPAGVYSRTALFAAVSENGQSTIWIFDASESACNDNIRAGSRAVCLVMEVQNGSSKFTNIILPYGALDVELYQQFLYVQDGE